MNKCLLAGDKFMSEMHLKGPGFMYSACGLFIKNKKKNTNNWRFKIYLAKRTR